MLWLYYCSLIASGILRIPSWIKKSYIIHKCSFYTLIIVIVYRLYAFCKFVFFCMYAVLNLIGIIMCKTVYFLSTSYPHPCLTCNIYADISKLILYATSNRVYPFLSQLYISTFRAILRNHCSIFNTTFCMSTSSEIRKHTDHL